MPLYFTYNRLASALVTAGIFSEEAEDYARKGLAAMDERTYMSRASSSTSVARGLREDDGLSRRREAGVRAGRRRPGTLHGRSCDARRGCSPDARRGCARDTCRCCEAATPTTAHLPRRTTGFADEGTA